MEIPTDDPHRIFADGLRKLYLTHDECEDCWYSCPKSRDGCCNDSYDTDECTCGADTHNALVDSLLASLASWMEDIESQLEEHEAYRRGKDEGYRNAYRLFGPELESLRAKVYGAHEEMTDEDVPIATWVDDEESGDRT
jgi:hypothetical protein